MVGRWLRQVGQVVGGIGQVGEVSGTPSRGSSPIILPNFNLFLAGLLLARGGWEGGWVRMPGIGAGSGSGPDSLFPAAWCDPLHPNGSWRPRGRAVLTASCTQWPWDYPATPRDIPGTSPHPSMAHGA